jgi:hypothetical protein
MRFTDILSPRHVGAPAAFISHMWVPTQPFAATSRRVLRYFQYDHMDVDERVETRVWFDVFAISQHPGGNQKLDLGGLDLAVREAGESSRGGRGTVVVLDKVGRTLTRIWCLFEIWRTAEDGNVLTVLTEELDGASLTEVFYKMDVEKAEASMPSDRVRLLDSFEASGTGFEQLNIVIKRALVEGPRQEAQKYLESGVR